MWTNIDLRMIKNPLLRRFDKLAAVHLLDSDERVGSAIHAASTGGASRFHRAATEHDLKQAHRVSLDYLESGKDAHALVLSMLNLAAACRADAWQWVEWTAGRSLNCIAKGCGPRTAQAMLAVLEGLAKRFPISEDPRSLLGTTVLKGTAYAVVASFASDETGSLAEAIYCGDAAIPLAEQVQASPLQRGSILLELGSRKLRLSQLTGGTDLKLLISCAENLSASRELLQQAHSPLAVQATKQLALAHTYSVNFGKVLLDEPALAPEGSAEIKEALLRSGKRAVELYEEILATLQNESTLDKEAGSCLMNQAELLLTLDKLGYSTPGRDLQAAADYALQAANYMETSGNTGACAFALAILAKISVRQAETAGNDVLEGVLPTIERAFNISHRAGEPFVHWKIASVLVDFLVKYQNPVDWDRVYQLCTFATNAMKRHSDAHGISTNDWLLQNLRSETDTLVRHYFRAAGCTGRSTELPRIWNLHTLFSSLAPDKAECFIDKHAVNLGLPDASTAIVYLDLDEQGLSGFVTNGGPAVFEDFIWDKNVTWTQVRRLADPWLAAYYRYVTASQKTDAMREVWWNALESLLSNLEPLLWRPIESRLHHLGICQVVLVLGRGLSILPLHGVRRTNNAEKHLLDDYTIVWAPSVPLLKPPSANAKNGLRLLAVGNPTYDLVWAELEAKLVATKFPFLRRTCLLRSRATPARVLKYLPNADVVHLACHGWFDMKRQGERIQVSGGIRLSGGTLSFHDLMATPLARRPLVVLSACETGRVNWRDTDPTGLSSAVLIAGARAVVGTFWVVDDLATTILMESFYAGLDDGMTPATALRAAQLGLRDIKAKDVCTRLSRFSHRIPTFRREFKRFSNIPEAERPFAHPYYWTAFYIMAGQIDPVLSV